MPVGTSIFIILNLQTMKLINYRYSDSGIEGECGVTLSNVFDSCEKKLPIRLENCSDSCELCKIIEHQLAFRDARWKKDVMLCVENVTQG